MCEHFHFPTGGATGLIITRTAIGFAQGPLIPSIASIMIAWIPVEERTRCCAIAYMGIHVGSFVSTYIVGLILHHSNRWDIIFYGLAIMGVIAAVVVVCSRRLKHLNQLFTR